MPALRAFSRRASMSAWPFSAGITSSLMKVATRSRKSIRSGGKSKFICLEFSPSPGPSLRSGPPSPRFAGRGALDFESPSPRLRGEGARRADEGSSLQILENRRRALSAANTHRHHAVARAAAPHLAQELHGEFRAAGAERVAERDGAAVHVDALGIHAE